MELERIFDRTLAASRAKHNDDDAGSETPGKGKKAKSRPSLGAGSAANSVSGRDTPLSPINIIRGRKSLAVPEADPLPNTREAYPFAARLVLSSLINVYPMRPKEIAARALEVGLIKPVDDAQPADTMAEALADHPEFYTPDEGCLYGLQFWLDSPDITVDERAARWAAESSDDDDDDEEEDEDDDEEDRVASRSRRTYKDSDEIILLARYLK